MRRARRRLPGLLRAGAGDDRRAPSSRIATGRCSCSRRARRPASSAGSSRPAPTTSSCCRRRPTRCGSRSRSSSRARRARPTARRRHQGRLICVLGPKGGSGQDARQREPRRRARRGGHEGRDRRPRPPVRRRRPLPRARPRADLLRPRARRWHARRAEARRLPDGALERRSASSSPPPGPTRRARSPSS